jgi:hypothetical protein
LLAEETHAEDATDERAFPDKKSTHQLDKRVDRVGAADALGGSGKKSAKARSWWSRRKRTSRNSSRELLAFTPALSYIGAAALSFKTSEEECSLARYLLQGAGSA